MSGGSYTAQASPLAFHRDAFSGGSRGIRTAAFSRDATIGRHSSTTTYVCQLPGRAPHSGEGSWGGAVARQAIRCDEGGPNVNRSSAGYTTYNTQKGPTGSLAAEMMERQRLHQKFERYIHNEDMNDQRKKAEEAKCLIRATGAQLVLDSQPLHYYDTLDHHALVGRGVAEPYEVQIETYGDTISKSIATVREERASSKRQFDQSSLLLRDTMYGRSPFQAELEASGVTSGDPLGMTPAKILQKNISCDGEERIKMLDAQVLADETKMRIYDARRVHYPMRPLTEVTNPITGTRTPAFTSAAQAAHLAAFDSTQRVRMAAQSAMMTRVNEAGIPAAGRSFFMHASVN